MTSADARTDDRAELQTDNQGERPESDWVAAHVFYHDRLDRLLTEAAAPLATELVRRGLADDFFFLRYWDGGPHLRFRALIPDDTGRAGATELIRRRFTEFLTAHPAPGEVDRSSYERSAEQLARWERLPGHEGLRPNNVVEFRPYRRERERYGYGRAVTAVERHFGESSRLALRLLSKGADAGQRFTAAYSMITLSWLPYVAEPAWDSRWVRMDEHLPAGAGLDRDDLERRWLRQRDTLCALTERLRVAARRSANGADTESSGSSGTGAAGPAGTVGAAGGNPGSGGELTDWIRSIERLERALTAEIAAGRFTPPTEQWRGSDDQPPEPRPPESGRPESGTGVLPVIDICSHLFCNRLGLSPTEEAYVRVLAMRAACETERNTHAVARDPRLLP